VAVATVANCREGGRHRSELVSSCLSSSNSQRRFLVLLAGGGAILGEGDMRLPVFAVGSKLERVQEEGWERDGAGAGGRMSSAKEAAGSRRRP
jgi:hypothetical protein